MVLGTFAPLRLVVGIPTLGRADQVRSVIAHLKCQTRQPEAILIAACDPADVAGVCCEGIKTLFPPRGLTTQRNAILGQCQREDIVVFFDDDFLPHPSYLEEVENVFRLHPEVVLVTGRVIADGIIGPGLSTEEALRLLEADNDGLLADHKVVEVYNGYGCNMAVRVKIAAQASVTFDEALPLYGWLEDVDFSRRMARLGRIVRSSRVRGVHLGTKSGRQSGVCLGYSQIANPLYLARKNTLAWQRALWQMARNLAMNLVFSLRAEPYIDRRGRLQGNVKGIKDLLFGRLSPERASAI
jgi:succinoglycan biosynthesis transport protein ExoP